MEGVAAEVSAKNLMGGEAEEFGVKATNEQPILWWCGWAMSVPFAFDTCWYLSQVPCSLLTSLHPRNSDGKLNYLSNHIVMFLDHPLLESGLGAFLTPFLFVFLCSCLAPHSRFKIAQWFSWLYWCGNFLWMGLGSFAMDLESTPDWALVWLLPLSLAGNLVALGLLRWLDCVHRRRIGKPLGDGLNN
jgi:hypothetical protein